MLPRPVISILARRYRRRLKSGCAALSSKIFSASHPERLPSFSISSSFVLFFVFLPSFFFMKIQCNDLQKETAVLTSPRQRSSDDVRRRNASTWSTSWWLTIKLKQSSIVYKEWEKKDSVTNQREKGIKRWNEQRIDVWMKEKVKHQREKKKMHAMCLNQYQTLCTWTSITASCCVWAFRSGSSCSINPENFSSGSSPGHGNKVYSLKWPPVSWMPIVKGN